MLHLLGRLAAKRAWLVLIVSALLAVVATWYGSGALKALRDGISPNPSSESTKQTEGLAHAFPDQQFALYLLLSSDRLKVDDPEFRTAAQPILDKLALDPSVRSSINYFDTGATQLVSKDRRETLVPIVLEGEGPEWGAAYLRLKESLKSTDLRIRLGGAAAVTKEINGQIKSDIARSERISFAILAVLLLFIFRSLVAALLPLVVGGLSIITALALTRFVANWADVTIYAANIITFLGLGLAIDYSLFILSRFREELEVDANSAAAVVRTMLSAGRTVAFSGSIVAISLLGLIVFPRNFLHSMAIGGAIAVVASVATSLTVLPALLALIGPRIEKGRLGRADKTKQDQMAAFWIAMSHFVMRKAGIVVFAVLAVLLLAGAPFLNVRFSTVDAKTLPVEFESRQVNDEMGAAFDFGPNDPIQILIRMPSSPDEEPNRTGLRAYVRRLQGIPGVTQVKSALDINPLQELPKTSGNATAIDIGYPYPTQSDEAQSLVERVRAVLPPQGSVAYVGGMTATLVDLLHDLKAHAAEAAAIIGIATFVLLLLMLNSILVPIKAIVFNALSLAAAFGALVWVFQYGNLENVIGFTSNGAIDANEPILIFVIAFGLAVDYEVFLVSRMKEAYDRGATTTDSVAFGLEKTGQIITSAALLLLVVIGAFTTGKLAIMKQLGFGLGLAILIDATLVRSLLVPATMRFLGKYNWWTPAPLHRLIAKINLAE